MLSAWEIRHGSVMALREILTHQGASACVILPYSSFDRRLFELENEGRSNLMRREREIDLNMQVSSDGPEPNLKRPKLQVTSDGPEPKLMSSKIEDVSPQPIAATIVSSSEAGNLDSSMKVDHGWNLPSGQVNGQLNVTCVKVEPESLLTEVSYSCKEAADTAETEGFSEDKVSAGKEEMLKSIPENYELINLVKVARHSWLKNCGFLQECAIRLLCVLSLDRYGFIY